MCITDHNIRQINAIDETRKLRFGAHFCIDLCIYVGEEELPSTTRHCCCRWFAGPCGSTKLMELLRGVQFCGGHTECLGKSEKDKGQPAWH